MPHLSPHFTLEEMTESGTALRLGIDNQPPAEALGALYDTAAGLERVRDVLNAPILISSGYRCPKLNTAVHGSKTSQHMLGQAADFKAPDFGTPLQICRELVTHADYIDFDQLIWEGTWVHISFSEEPRGEVKTAHFNSGKVTYTKWLP